MLVVLEGCVMLRVNGQEFVVRSGMAFTSRLGEQQVMNAVHAPTTTYARFRWA
jgi:uncharacterized cupin superfamily protein